MKSNARIEVTAASIDKALAKGASSLTRVWKALGGSGSVSGGTAGKMRALVPGIDSIMAANKTAEGGDDSKPKGKRPAADKTQPAHDEGERLCPYRLGSKYAHIWLLLYKAGKTGTTRQKIVDHLVSKGLSDAKTAAFAVQVVSSPTREGTANRSANRAADIYWVEKGGSGGLRLHLRDGKA